MSKPTANYWVDVIIGIAFIGSAISGIVFLLPAGAGASAGLLGLSMRAWSNLHTWSSIVMIAGVGAHLALHWKWITHMTRRKLLSQFASPSGTATSGAAEGAPARSTRVDARRNQDAASRTAGSSCGPAPVMAVSNDATDAGEISHDRRSFLKLGGAATVATGMLIAGIKLGSAGGNMAGGEPAAGGDAAQGAGGSSSTGAASGVENPLGSSSAAADTAPAGASGSEAADLEGAAQAQPVPSTEIQARPVTDPEPEQGVACRFGIVDDPYPGQCRHYVDSTGSGICDYSVLGSGNVKVFGG